MTDEPLSAHETGLAESLLAISKMQDRITDELERINEKYDEETIAGRLDRIIDMHERIDKLVDAISAMLGLKFSAAP